MTETGGGGEVARFLNVRRAEATPGMLFLCPRLWGCPGLVSLSRQCWGVDGEREKESERQQEKERVKEREEIKKKRHKGPW